MIDWLNGKILELTSLVRGAAVLLAVTMVAYAYLRTRSLVTLLVAALTAGIFLWAINNTGWWQEKVGEESTAPVIVPASVSASESSYAGLLIVAVDGV